MPISTLHLMQAYSRQSVSFTHGLGAHLWDAQGREYLDAIAGVAVTNLGHAHPEIARVIADQAGLQISGLVGGKGVFLQRQPPR